MRTLSALIAALLVLGICAGVPRRPADVSAGTAVRLDVAQLASRADLIVEGRVLQSRVIERDQMVETEYLLRVDRTFAGEDLSHRSVRIPGGVLPDGRGMILAGVPRLLAGEDVLLFLSRESRSGVRMPIGLSQGKYRRVETEAGERLLVREPAGVSLVEPDGAVRPATESRVRVYAEVVAEIEAALARKRAR